MIYIVLGVLLLIFVLIGIIIHLSTKSAVDRTENLRLKDVVKSQNLTHTKYAAVVDKFTKERYQFYEKAKSARTPNDYINIYNELLEIEPVNTTVPSRELE